MSATDTVYDVDELHFATDVLERSHEVPVVVDFWAAWCGPCRTLGPMLEAAVAERGGDVVLAKLDVDANQRLAAQFRVQGIPAVKAFRDGQVVAEFTGAVPRTSIEAFLDQVVPTPADRATRRGQMLGADDPAAATAAFREALDLDPNHRGAAIGLGSLLVAEDPQAALDLVTPHRPFPEAEAVAARAELALIGGGDTSALEARLAADPDDAEAHLLLGRALAATGDHEVAAEHLLAAVDAGGEHREPAREQLVSLFTALGDQHELVQRTRPRLARALF